MKTDEDKQKDARFLVVWLPVALCVGLFIRSWRENHSILFAVVSAILGTVAGMIGAIAFAALWAKTHSLIIAFLVVAAGGCAIFLGVALLWNMTHP